MRSSAYLTLGLVSLAGAYWLAAGERPVLSPPAAEEITRAGPAPAPLRAPASGTPDPVPAVQDPAFVSTLAERLERTRACYETDCDYPRTDPKSYAFAVGLDLKRQLLDASARAARDRLQDPQLSALARAHLENDDGHVQEAALALLATQPASAENLEAILNHVIAGYDAELIRQALRELERYQSDGERERIASALAEAMVTGSPLVAKEISAAVAPFVDRHNLRIYEEASSRLLPGSIVKARLDGTLEKVVL